MHTPWPKEICDKVESICIDQGWDVKCAAKLEELCTTGNAFLFQFRGSFAIVQAKIDWFTGDKIAVILAGWGERGEMDFNMDLLREFARRIKAVRFEMLSPRRGFERTGWEVKSVIYTQPVN